MREPTPAPKNNPPPPPPDPAETFRQRLNVILKDMVQKLETLSAEVLPPEEDKTDG